MKTPRIVILGYIAYILHYVGISVFFLSLFYHVVMICIMLLDGAGESIIVETGMRAGVIAIISGISTLVGSVKYPCNTQACTCPLKKKDSTD